MTLLNVLVGISGLTSTTMYKSFSESVIMRGNGMSKIKINISDDGLFIYIIKSIILIFPLNDDLSVYRYVRVYVCLYICMYV